LLHSLPFFKEKIPETNIDLLIDGKNIDRVEIGLYIFNECLTWENNVKAISDKIAKNRYHEK